jgi:hypothetical protein
MLAPPSSPAGQKLRAQRPRLPTAFFFHCVTEAIDAIEEAVPDALTHIDICVEDVPEVSSLWSSHMPLAYATEADETHLAQIIIYRRPIELRTPDRPALRQLVFVALVEQVARATGVSVETLDPHNLRGE